MQVFGLTITKALPSLSPVYSGRSGSSWFGTIAESFAGAWQRNIECESRENVLKFSAVYSCVSLISNDIAKLRIKLTEKNNNGTWDEVEPGSPFLPVLRKPNRYQTRIQFLSHWITTKLLHGNVYILKERDQRGVVTALFVLDSQRVTPLVADDGGVYYQLNDYRLAGLDEQVTVPASEIIHDRMECFFHPLIGVSAIYACASSSTQGIRIQANSARFFENMSRPSGQLTAPGAISDVTAIRLKNDFEANFGGGRIGRLFVAGDGLKYEAMTIPAADAQLIEQLRWTVEDVARCFHVPLHKLGMGQPTLNNIGALNQDYYSQALQTLIESLELCLDEGLSLPSKMGTELDLEGLLRMDPLTRAQMQETHIRAGILAPNEVRLQENRPPAVGGESPYLQMQNFSLAALAKRDAQADPFATAAPAAPALPAPKPEPNEDVERMADVFIKGLEESDVCVA